MATRSCCSTPRTAVAGARSATSAQAPCRSTRRSSALATIHISWNCARPTVEPLQRIDAKQECRSLETTDLLSVLRPQRTLRALLVTGANQWQIDVTGADQWQINAMAFQPAELGGDALARRDEFVRFRIGYRADQKEGGKSRRCALFGLVVKRCDGNQCPD